MRLLSYIDEPVVSEAMSVIFSQTPDIKLEKLVDTVEQIFPAVQKRPPDILLLSVTPALHLGVLARLREMAPACPIVLWTRAISQEIAHQAMELGVRGILPRTYPTELMIKCLRKVHAGELWFDRQLTSTYLNCHRVALTPRQAQLAQLVAEGRRNKEIAASLSLSEGAVKVYLSHLFEKVGAKDRTELAQLVIRNVQSIEFADQFTGASGAHLRALYIDNAAAVR